MELTKVPAKSQLKKKRKKKKEKSGKNAGPFEATISAIQLTTLNFFLCTTCLSGRETRVNGSAQELFLTVYLSLNRGYCFNGR